MTYSETANPPATERAGPDKPPPTVARASALPDNFREGSWKRGLWWNCAPTRNRKGGTGQASTYGCARQCPTRQAVSGIGDFLHPATLRRHQQRVTLLV